MPRRLMCLWPIGAMLSRTSSGYAPGASSTASCSGDVNGLDIGELADLMLLDPGKEVARGPVMAMRVFLFERAAKNSRKRRAA